MLRTFDYRENISLTNESNSRVSRFHRSLPFGRFLSHYGVEQIVRKNDQK